MISHGMEGKRMRAGNVHLLQRFKVCIGPEAVLHKVLPCIAGPRTPSL